MHVKTYGLGEESVNAKLFYLLIVSHFITAFAIQITDLPENILQKRRPPHENTKAQKFSYSLLHFFQRIFVNF